MMLVDIIVILVFILAIYKGIEKGFITGMLMFIAYIIAIFVALKLAIFVSSSFDLTKSEYDKWLPLVIFAIVTALLVFSLKIFVMRALHSFRFYILTGADKGLGVGLYLFLHFIILLIVFVFIDKYNLIKQEYISESHLYPGFRSLGEPITASVLNWFPWLQK
jgi:uncharacterized membrane protein required for colicin V production